MGWLTQVQQALTRMKDPCPQGSNGAEIYRGAAPHQCRKVGDPTSIHMLRQRCMGLGSERVEPTIPVTLRHEKSAPAIRPVVLRELYTQPHSRR